MACKLTWERNNKTYTVTNVPNIEDNTHGLYFDLEVVEKLVMVRDMMELGMIEDTLDYSLIVDYRVNKE